MTMMQNVWKFGRIITSALLLLQQFQIGTSDISSSIPIIYISFGAAPDYVVANIALALRNNDKVVLISDVALPFSVEETGLQGHFLFDNMGNYETGSNSFKGLYKHVSIYNRPPSVEFELRCFQRWFILREYMRANNIQRAAFGDGDSAFFVNVTQIYRKRSSCSAIINVEAQEDHMLWIGAGEASIWSYDAIADFCQFMEKVYATKVDLLMKKKENRSTVTDMSLLWMWWVSHHENDVWHPARAWQPWRGPNLDKFERSSKHAFEWMKGMNLPVGTSLQLCNGMIPTQGSVFDHMHGWVGQNFSIDIPGRGRPHRSPYSVDSIAKAHPGGSGTKGASTVHTDHRLHLVNIHYQGGGKRFLLYDVCRVLKLGRGPGRLVAIKFVDALCEAALSAHALPQTPGGETLYPCLNHENYDEQPPTCV